MTGTTLGPCDGPDDPMTGIELMDRPPGATWTWPVHRTGDLGSPPVIVMHEIFGMSRTYTNFCRELAERGFSVWMPQLGGRTPSLSNTDHARAALQLCISREINILWSGRTSRVVTPLRELARHLSNRYGGGPVGVVGMCLTGGFALAMAAEPGVAGAVLAQPALPFRIGYGRALGLSDADKNAVGGRLAAGDVGILYLRFARDPISPPQRCAAVQALGPGVEVDTVSDPRFALLDHSVLTQARVDYCDQDDLSDRLSRSAAGVSDFLHRRLGTVAPGASG